MVIGKGKIGAAKGKEVIEDADVVDPKGTVSAKDKAAANKVAAEEKAAEKAAAKAAADAEKAEAKEKADTEKAEAKEKAKEEREAGKGLSKLLRSFLARIKYMVYMDNPAAGIEGIDNLGWTLQFTNSKGALTTVTRGTSTTEIEITVGEGKKAVVTTSAADGETLETLFATWEY